MMEGGKGGRNSKALGENEGKEVPVWDFRHI